MASALTCLRQVLETGEPQLDVPYGVSRESVKPIWLLAMGLKETPMSLTFSADRLRYAVDDVDTLTEDGLDRLFALINEVRGFIRGPL